MIYYTGLLVYIFVVYFFSLFIKNKKKGKQSFFILVCLGVVLFQGFRDFSVGTDLVGYIPSYVKIGNKDFLDLKYQNYEIGYIILNKVLFSLGLDEREFLLTLAAIIQIPIFFTIYRYSKYYLTSILWYFAFGNFLMTFSGLRQSIAMSLCFSAYYFIKNNKKYKFIIFILCSSLFHKSALFCLILYPLYFIKIDRKKTFLVLLTFIFLFLFKGKIFIFFSRLYYSESSTIVDTGAYTMLIVYFLFYIFALLLDKKEKDYQGLKNILLLLTTIYIFSSISNTIIRIGFPLTLYMTIFIPKLINSIKVKPYFLYMGAFLICVILCFYYMLGTLDTLPFKFG